jgi:N-acetylmuramoyl-L-alanine amidase
VSASPSPDRVRPFGIGARGEHVRDLQRRLVALGFGPGAIDSIFGPRTAGAVEDFQRDRGLDVDAICGPQTWAALVEAGYGLGSRLLYVTRPPQRGEDVAELQRRLGHLGFDAGRVDGIFGPESADAVREFQRNVGLVGDGIFGPDTERALARLGARSFGDVRLTTLRATTDPPAATDLIGCRIVVAEDGGLGALASSIRRPLAHRGARVLTIHHPDGSAQAAQSNRFGADVALALRAGDRGSECWYYATTGFESEDGRRLAELLAESLAPVLGEAVDPRGMRLPVLRETRMPTVVCRLRPLSVVVGEGYALGEAVSTAVDEWRRAQRPVTSG